jgi:hypothetical protein
MIDAKGGLPESWACIDCGTNTAPGCSTRAEFEVTYSLRRTFDDQTEVYVVRAAIWKAAGMEDYGGCLCIGCLEKRIGRKLRPKDFMRNHPFTRMPGTKRLLARRGG